MDVSYKLASRVEQYILVHKPNYKFRPFDYELNSSEITKWNFTDILKPTKEDLDLIDLDQVPRPTTNTISVCSGNCCNYKSFDGSIIYCKCSNQLKIFIDNSWVNI